MRGSMARFAALGRGRRCAERGALAPGGCLCRAGRCRARPARGTSRRGARTTRVRDPFGPRPRGATRASAGGLRAPHPVRVVFRADRRAASNHAFDSPATCFPGEMSAPNGAPEARLGLSVAVGGCARTYRGVCSGGLVNRLRHRVVHPVRLPRRRPHPNPRGTAATLSGYGPQVAGLPARLSGIRAAKPSGTHRKCAEPIAPRVQTSLADGTYVDVRLPAMCVRRAASARPVRGGGRARSRARFRPQLGAQNSTT